MQYRYIPSSAAFSSRKVTFNYYELHSDVGPCHECPVARRPVSVRHMAIRDATPADAPVIEHIKVAGWRAAYTGIVPQAYLDAMAPDDTAIANRRDQMARSSIRFLIAEDDRAGVTGFVTFGPDRDGHSAGEVYAVYVAPTTWSRGHGHALLGGAGARLAEAGYPAAGLWVLADNAHARRFYERFGMRPTGEHKAFEVHGTAIPEVRYEMELPGGPAPRTADGRRNL